MKVNNVSSFVFILRFHMIQNTYEEGMKQCCIRADKALHNIGSCAKQVQYIFFKNTKT
jgi:hypothetical protein